MNGDANERSTSAKCSSIHEREMVEVKNDEELIKLLQATDEVLENKAKSMNLSSLNVRSILHHLIKYPSTIDVLLGIRETDDLPSVRNTRSRKKPDDSDPSSRVNTPKKIAIRIEDRGPKSFLDLEYEEDDEYDDDYVDEGESSQKDVDAEESEDEEEVFDEEEDDDDIESAQNDLNHQKDELGDAEPSAIDDTNDLHNLLLQENNDQEEYPINFTLNDTRPGSAILVHTLDNVVDDDDYRDFVKSIKFHPGDDAFQEAYNTEDDTEDEDYNVITDNLNVEDWDETRQDKTTMIPRHEVKALMMDTLLAEKDIPISILPDETIREEQKKSQKDKYAEVCDRINESVTLSTESCTLLRSTQVTFRPQEIDQLKMQLEQHVQFLTQFVVTCHHDDKLAHVRNSAQTMMNELDDIRQQRMFNTIFDVPNLDNAIETCHDINLFPPVDPMSLNYAKNSEGCLGKPLRPEAAAVLSRSKAIRYPALIPLCQPEFIPQRLTHFLHEEDIMLAIALLQFAHLPRRAEKNVMDRYNVIERNCLPARSAYHIRNHLKTMRRASKNPIHEIIQVL
uniref:GON-4-like protein n=1 Tax=Caenorhabditis tropicalis TaxID=1561998 RepID=A0A1I7TD88_9PELO